ncbi:MAG: YitT family protein [Lachnospiraceae bacterium]|nr:YitT family protein [Lachnospiraceae bacterium]
MTFSLKEDGKRLLVITLAAVMMAFNLTTFVNSGGLYPGGATGLTVLILRVAKSFFNVALPYTFVNLLLSIFPIYIGFRYVGRKMTIYTIYMIVLSGVLTDIFPKRVVTEDMLLIAIFGGIISGTLISLCLMSNANSGGTDFIALYLSKKRGKDSFNIILGVNCVIIGIAGMIFGWEKALYSILYQYVSTQVLHVLYRRYQQTTLFIVTDYPQEICQSISQVCRHGATILRGEGSYKHVERALVYSIVSAEEARKVLAAVQEQDPHAFVNAIRTEQLQGRFYQPPTE